MHQAPRGNPFGAALAVLLATVALTPSPVLAQSRWTGAGPDDNWSTGANWEGGVPPVSGPTTVVYLAYKSPRPSPIVDAPWTLNELSIGTFQTYTLAGQAITLDGASPRIGVFSASLSIANPIVLAAPTGIGLCNGGILTLSGAISGPGSLMFSGRLATARLNGAHTYAGGTSVSNVTLDLRGSILGALSLWGSPFSTACASGGPGVLIGSGTIAGPVQVAANGSNADLIPDLVLGTGNLALEGGSRLLITINGPAQGSQYASVNVTGSVVLYPTGGCCSTTGARLQLQGSYTPVPGDVFTIIANDGSDPVTAGPYGATGIFEGLPEGAFITFNGVPLRISYMGGTGNDVTLSAGPTGPAPRLANISTRALVQTGDNVMIGGFVIGGSSSKTIAVVATGPSLAAFGITNPLGNPTLRLVRSSDQAVLASNDDWQSAANAAQLQAAGFAPTHDLESAILINLPPGAYTAIVEGVGGTTGVSVIGVYEVDAVTVPLVNISTRAHVLTGENVMIGGFVIQGSIPQTVAVVATGPSLGALGIANPLANPTLTLVRSSDQAVVGSNDNWQTDINAAQLQAAGFAPGNTLESGLYRTLAPGAYTAIVQGVGGGTGIAVIGVYKAN